jgi:cytochrome c5
MKRIKYIVISFFVAAIVACGGTSFMFAPTPDDVTKIKNEFPDATSAELEKGFHLYKANCSGCHTLYVPTSKNRAEWEKVFPEMFLKTSLKAEEQRLVKQYVFAKAIPTVPVAESAH